MSAERRRRLLITAGIGLGIVVLVVVAMAAIGSGVPRGTTVMGVDIGGMSEADAVQTLEASIGTQAAEPIRLRAGDEVFMIDTGQAGMSFDAAATVAQADQQTFNPLRVLTQLFTSKELAPVVSIDDAALRARLADVALAVDIPASEPTLTMDGKRPVLVAGVDGRGLDVDATAALLEESFLQPRRALAGIVEPVSPSVSSDAAQSAVAFAEAAVAAPVVVSTGESEAKIRPRAIARALSFSAEDGQLQPSLNGATLYDAVGKRLAIVENPGRDATFKIVDGAPVVVPSKVGRGVSNDELAAQVLSVLGNRPGDRQVTVSIGVREPKLTTEQAKALGVTDRLSTFTQNFPYAAYRVQNIGQAAKNVNGTLLMPGETFSMNDTIKERTEANGYTVGFVVGPGGVFAEELGGGVSTATTATWTAAFYAGMERVFTQAHSIYISRYQPGLEATVAWGIFDMKFRNDTPNAVFITATTTNTSITVSFWGTKQYDDVKAEFGPKRNVVPFTTVYDKSKKCLGQSGVDGFTIDVDRVFIKDGSEAKRERITTLYRPAPEVICGKKQQTETEFGKNPKPGKTPSPSATPAPTDAPPATEGAPEFGN